MLIKQVMEIFDLLDSPSASGEEVARSWSAGALRKLR